jgi:hypothetical protein
VHPQKLEHIKDNFDALLSQKNGPCPEKGWAALAGLGDLPIRS